jgi:hypothetical protein
VTPCEFFTESVATDYLMLAGRLFTAGFQPASFQPARMAQIFTGQDGRAI